MSVLAVVTQPGAITIAEDTATRHAASGALLGEASHVVALAHIRTLVASVGPAGFAHQFVGRFAADLRGFDHAAANLSSWLRQCAGGASVTVIIAGWSVAAGRFAAVRASSLDRAAADLCSGANHVTRIPAWSVSPMNRFWCSEAPDAAYFDWMLETASGSTEIAARLVVAAREHGVEEADRRPGSVSRLSITRLTPDEVQCRVLQRFDPDEGVPTTRGGAPINFNTLRPEIL